MNIKLYVSEFLWLVYPMNRDIFQPDGTSNWIFQIRNVFNAYQYFHSWNYIEREGVNYKKANVRSFLLTVNRFSYMTQLNQARVIQLSWSTKA